MIKQIPPRIVLASENPGKLREIKQIFSGLHIEALPQTQFNVPDVEETGLSFVENAIIKARNAAKCTSLPALADDSGIEVDALNGQPGIYSGRYGGKNASDLDNLQKLLHDLKDVPDAKRTARYQCLMVYMAHENDPTPLIFQGTWEGRILFQPQGDNGFGYDPIFLVPPQNCTAAELDSTTKNQLSHRGQALTKLLHAFQSAAS